MLTDTTKKSMPNDNPEPSNSSGDDKPPSALGRRDLPNPEPIGEDIAFETDIAFTD